MISNPSSASMAGKAKARYNRCPNLEKSLTLTMLRTMIAQLISTAQTGFAYTTTRLRLGRKLKYDPIGERDCCHSVNSLVESRVFVVSQGALRIC